MNTRTNSLPLNLYLLNATLLLCHEIDSAYWQEWNLFHLPGGAEGFVALHIIVVGVVLWGLIAVDRGYPSCRWFSLLLGSSGVIGGILHTAVLIGGNKSFSSWFSVGLIAAFMITSISQVVTTLIQWRTVPQGRKTCEQDRQ